MATWRLQYREWLFTPAAFGGESEAIREAIQRSQLPGARPMRVIGPRGQVVFVIEPEPPHDGQGEAAD